MADTANKCNATRAQFFKDHAHMECLCTSDDSYFFNNEAGKNHAAAHAGNLVRLKKNGNVDLVTRADYDAWLAAELPARYERAKANLEELLVLQKNAQAGVDACGAAPKDKKGINAYNLKLAAANRVLNDVNKRVAAAEKEVADAEKDNTPAPEGENAGSVGAAVATAIVQDAVDGKLKKAK